MNKLLDEFLIEDTLKYALKEDMNNGDITSDSLMDESLQGRALITSKEAGVICGLDVVKLIFSIVDRNLKLTKLVKDGDDIGKGRDLILLEGSLKSILKAERVALNFLQRMSGIASKTKEMSELVKDLDVKIVDTRKTTPGLRIFEKYAVKTGGGFNHRFNLSDSVMIKDNHIEAVGSIEKAIKIIRSEISHTRKIEIEVKNLTELKEALDNKADIVMLDNMDIDDMKKAVKITNKRAILEASGNITEKTIRQVANTGIDIISVGGLTHSFDSMDISLNVKLTEE